MRRITSIADTEIRLSLSDWNLSSAFTSRLLSIKKEEINRTNKSRTTVSKPQIWLAKKKKRDQRMGIEKQKQTKELISKAISVLLKFNIALPFSI